MVALFVAVAFAGGDEVVARRVDGLGPRGEWMEVRLVGKKPVLVMGDDRTGFACYPAGFGASYIRKALVKYADTVDEVAAAVRAGRRMEFDVVGGFVGSQMAGYCNLAARTDPVDDAMTGFLGFGYNRACFGSAGCNRDAVTLVITPETAGEVASALRWGAGL